MAHSRTRLTLIQLRADLVEAAHLLRPGFHPELNGPRGAGSAPGIRLGRLALELQRHERFIAYDPGVVARLETVCVTRAEAAFSPVGRPQAELARHDISQVRSMTTVS